ncbi:MAG: ribulose-5-phosphate 4-epimerase/fuculose-1-phosphate aldolase [Nonlabens sp.]|jgi:ribulose-5-phosphate 4-epimerase/fuculose-1-phosphate aldolase
MASIEHLRNNLISKLMTIRDQKMLNAIEQLIITSDSKQKVELTEEQMLMLEMSEEDIKEGRTISQEELFTKERQWLNAYR